MYIKKLMFFSGLVLLGILIFFTTQTSLFSSPSPSKEVVQNGIRIGFSLGDLREERWQKDRDSFVAAAEKAGVFVQVTSANSDAILQNSQIENFISQGVDAIVIVPYDGDKMTDVIAMAKKANIKVISYDRLIKNADIDFYVSFDNVKVGSMEASGVTALKKTGNFAYIGGAPTDNNAVLLKQGSMEVLAPLMKDGSIKLVVDTFTPDWKPEEAYNTIKEYLAKGGTLDAVVAANDGTASGVIRALKEFNLVGKVPVSGQDAELSACQRVIEGSQSLTVYKPIPALAEKALGIAVTLARGETPVSNSKTNNSTLDVPSYFLDPIMVTKGNMEETVVKDGYHTRDQVYNSAK